MHLFGGPKLIDRKCGRLRVGELWIDGSMTLTQIKQAALPLQQRWQGPTGWVLLSAPVQRYGEAEIHVSFMFDVAGLIQYVSFGRYLEGIDPWEGAGQMQEANRKLLEAELGPPHVVEAGGARVRYSFGWGAVDVSIDPKGGTSSVVMTWKAVAPKEH